MARPRLLIVGRGSAGERHARLAEALGAECAFVSRRAGHGFGSMVEGLEVFGPSHVAIANATGDHWEGLRDLRERGFAGPVLVEKPVAATMPSAEEQAALARYPTFVAYNLRFHPEIERMRREIAGARAVNAVFLAGQDLSTWRPSRPVADCYSSRAADGGGVLRDLSHELDLARHLLGPITRLAAVGGKLGPLDISSDDAWSIIASSDRCPSVAISLDYYNRPGRRLAVVNLNNSTVSADLSGSANTPDRDTSYRIQLEHFFDSTRWPQLCSLEDGLATLAVIEATERAAADSRWESL